MKLKILLFVSILTVLFSGIFVVQATGTFGDWEGNLGKVAPATGIADHSIPDTLGVLIKLAMGILSTVFFALMVYAGWKWFAALGNEESAKKARGTLVSACIGLVITVSSFALSDFVVTGFINGAGGGRGSTSVVEEIPGCCLDLVQRCTEESIVTDIAIPRWAWRITTPSDCEKRGNDDKDPNDCKYGNGTWEFIGTVSTPAACEELWNRK